MDERPGRFVFMKVGNHAGEPWEEVLSRKRLEIEKAGVAFWGYGGSACHPKWVQRFAKLSVQECGPIYVLMQRIDSRHNRALGVATEYSIDGRIWEPIPPDVRVIGSRYALVLGEITPGDLEINMNHYVVGAGPSQGKRASDYVRGRIDKACLVHGGLDDGGSSENLVKISCAARLVKPYAVLVR